MAERSGHDAEGIPVWEREGWARRGRRGSARGAVPGLGWSSREPVEPGAGAWGPAPAPDVRRYRIPPPPANDSPATRAELAELHRLTAGRSAADVEQVHRWSTAEATPLTHWAAALEEAARTHGLTPPAGARAHALLSQAVYCALVACWQHKYLFRRPRPSDLDPEIDVSVIPVPQHPSYPAGHSAVAGAAATVLRTLFPGSGRRFAAMAEDSGLSRLKAGIHYRSDHTAGLALGEAVARGILAAAGRDGGPVRFRG